MPRLFLDGRFPDGSLKFPGATAKVIITPVDRKQMDCQLVLQLNCQQSIAAGGSAAMESHVQVPATRPQGEKEKEAPLKAGRRKLGGLP